MDEDLYGSKELKELFKPKEIYNWKPA